jgi:predicted transcriptional regulator
LKGRVGDRNKIWILDLIAKNNNDITTSDLVEETKLHRDTIYSNCKELMEEGYITKSGKKGTYHLTLKAFSKPNLRGQNFAREAIVKPIKWSGTSFKTLAEEQQTLLKLFEKYLEIIRTSNDNNVIQQELISYSVLMGAYTTYVFLEALNPDKWIFKQNGKKWEKDMSSLTEREKDDVIRLWINNSINPDYLFKIFKKLNIITRDDTDFDRLIKSYAEVFPDLYNKFESINKRMNEPQTERSDEEIYSEDKTGYLDSLDRKNKKIKSSDD